MQVVPDQSLSSVRLSETAQRVIRQKNEGETNADLRFLIGAAQLAIEDSRLTYDPACNNIGLILTHECPGVDKVMEKIFEVAGEIVAKPGVIARHLSMAKIADMLVKKVGTDVYEMQTFIFLYLVAKAFNLHGHSLYVNNACASGLFAIESAARQIRNGGSSAVVVVAGEHPQFFTKQFWFKQMGLYAMDGEMRPFDKTRRGIVLGDGATGLVLEERDHAIQRGAKIYAEYLGGGFRLEGGHAVLPNVKDPTYLEAVNEALCGAGVKPENIDLLVPHGVGTSLGDTCEADVITRVFGEFPYKPRITAFKGYVGHNLGGSALLETVLLLLSMDNSAIPPTRNCQTPDPALKLEPVREWTPANIDIAMKIATGFAGYHAAAVFGKNIQ